MLARRCAGWAGGGSAERLTCASLGCSDILAEVMEVWYGVEERGVDVLGSEFFGDGVVW